MITNTRLLLFLLVLNLLACKSYKQDILFNVDEQAVIEQAIYDVEKNYRIQPNDVLEIRVYTNDGERAIDPNGDFVQGGQNNSQNFERQNPIQYLVLVDGTVRFPMVGVVKVGGLTLAEAEEVLQDSYNEFYKDAYVKLFYLNKRATVLGHINAVVPLQNDNMSLMEVLAAAGGVTFGSRAHNIRVLRGDLSNPEVFIIDLTTVTGMQNSIIDIQPGDIIYLEPWRRPWLEVLRDLTPIVSLLTSITTLTVLIITLTQN